MYYLFFFFFSSRRRHTSCGRDWSSDVCSSDLGWVEGFKAVSDLYCVMTGEFAGSNPELEADITLLDADPYERGWIYRVRGKPEPVSVDVQGYVEILDLTIDRMQKKQQE